MLYKIKLSIDVLIEFYTYVFIFIKKVRLEKIIEYSRVLE